MASGRPRFASTSTFAQRCSGMTFRFRVPSRTRAAVHAIVHGVGGDDPVRGSPELTPAWVYGCPACNEDQRGVMDGRNSRPDSRKPDMTFLLDHDVPVEAARL